MEPNSQHPLIGILSVILVVLLFGCATIGWFFMETQNKLESAEQKIQELSLTLSEREQLIAEKISADAQKAAEENAKISMLKVITPNGGEIICPANPHVIQWQAPPDLDAVVLTLSTPTTKQRITEAAAVQNTVNGIGYGSTEWNFVNQAGYAVYEGSAYKIWLTATYQGKTIEDYSDGVFMLKNCP